MKVLHPPHAPPGKQGARQGGEAGPAPKLPFSWMSVLWQRGMAHKNPQVQRFVLGSFLGRHWVEESLAQIPPSFLTTHMFPALANAASTRGHACARLYSCPT